MKGFFGAAAVLTSIIIWALSYPLVKILLNEGIPPLTIALLRHLVFIPLLPIALARGKINYSRKTWLILISLGIFTVFLPNVTQNIGMIYTTASMTSIIQSSSPIFTLILAFIFLGEEKSLNKVIGAIIAMIGIVFLVSGGRVELTGTTFGNVLILISSISYAVSGVIIKKGLEEINPLHLLCFEITFGFLFLLPATLLMEDIHMIFYFDLFDWFLILILAIFATAVAGLLYYLVLMDVELSRLSIITYLIPVFAVIFSHLLLKETISKSAIIFTLIAIAGIAIASFPTKQGKVLK